MNINIKNKSVLITGSTSGIGLAIAKRLANEGAKLAIHGLGSHQENKLVIDEIKSSALTPEDVLFVEADLTDPAQTQAAAHHVISSWGSVDILINNAGIQHTDPIEAFPAEKWQQILAVNLSSAFYLIQESLPKMQERGYGRIINIASVHGLVASKEKAAYVAAKHGMIGLSKVVALENANNNITCNTICPGWVRTPLIEQQIEQRATKNKVSTEEAAKLLLQEKEPSLRFTSTNDIADATLFLLSSAGNNITGSALTMDGGWTAQ